MIKALDIGSISENYRNKYDNDMIYLNNINRLNIFIGENNSGKSRLLRYLIKGSDTKVFIEDSDDNLTNNYKRAKNEFINNVKYYNDYSNIRIAIPEEYNNLDEYNYFCEVSNYIYSLGINQETLNNNNAKSYFSSLLSYLEEMKKYLLRTTNGYAPKKFKELDVTYIPILRGIESFDKYYQISNNNDIESIAMTEKQRSAMQEYKDNSKKIYTNKVSKAYDINRNQIFTAENLYDDVVNKLLSNENDRNFIKEFEEFISKEFYNGEGFTIIPQIQQGYLNVKIGNGKERALHDLGDGIKQLITIFYKLFEKRKSNSIFLIEEPELNLHPGYQRQFIEILQNNKNFSKHQYFITTHSNHMIDSCLAYDNISIYKFININKNNNTFQVINTTFNDIEILELIGVYNSSVFMSNCTIWVEGISDKILISKYLEVYMKEKKEFIFKEDVNYSFVEYGGNNITHWAFLSNDDIDSINSCGISNRSLIVLDNDNDAKGKIKRKKNLQNIFKERYCELNVREIENTISRKILERTLFGDREVIIKKGYLDKEYENKVTRMGKFINEHYKLNKNYASSTGSIANKLEFSKKIAYNIKTIDDLSKNAIKLCETIYQFIKKSNYK